MFSKKACPRNWKLGAKLVNLSDFGRTWKIKMIDRSQLGEISDPNLVTFDQCSFLLVDSFLAVSFWSSKSFYCEPFANAILHNSTQCCVHYFMVCNVSKLWSFAAIVPKDNVSNGIIPKWHESEKFPKWHNFHATVALKKNREQLFREQCEKITVDWHFILFFFYNFASKAKSISLRLLIRFLWSVFPTNLSLNICLEAINSKSWSHVFIPGKTFKLQW